MPIVSRPLAILAYGSLLHSPGPELAAVIVAHEPAETPFPVEYGRASARWNGGPVLVPHPSGGPVRGALLVLAPGIELGVAMELLAAREGLDGTRGIVEVAVPGKRLVITASLPRNLPAPDMRPDALARRAVASVGAGPRNGVAYLAAAIGCGVRTPVTDAYVRAILRRTGAGSLEDAEERLVALVGTRTEGAHGLG